MSNIADQKKLEIETDSYKMFMRVAKRVRNLEYNKWTIEPDINDPLRKFTLNRDIGWATLKLCLVIEEFYRRGVYNGNRYDYRCRVGVQGLFQDKRGTIVLNTGMKVRPRMAIKLVTTINEVIIPKFYEAVEHEATQRQERINALSAFSKEISKVKGLEHIPNTYYGGATGKLVNCPFKLTLNNDKVELEGALSYDDLAKFAEANKWGGYK